MIDVREPDEYVEVHAKDVRLIPVGTVLGETRQIREFADGKEVLFICKTGRAAPWRPSTRSQLGWTRLRLRTSRAGRRRGWRRACQQGTEPALVRTANVSRVLAWYGLSRFLTQQQVKPTIPPSAYFEVEPTTR